MAINKQFVFCDEHFIPNPFEVQELRIKNNDVEKIPSDMGVYIIEKENNQLYIGKSVNITRRLKDHELSGKLKNGDNFTFFTSKHFNESHISTLETKLINHSKFFDECMLINIRKDQKEYKYYNKDADEKIYSKLVEEFHEILLKERTEKDFNDVVNTHEYKISPRNKQLTKEQNHIVNKIFTEINLGQRQIQLLTGKPGTGKSIAETKIVDKLSKLDNSILLTSGLTNLNSTFKKLYKDKKFENVTIKNVGKAINEFYSQNKMYDFVVIDEGHRLKKKGTGKASALSTQHIRNYNELEDLLKIGRNIIIVFDKDQISMPADITTKEMFLTLNESNLSLKTYNLNEQVRNDIEFEKWVKNFLSSKKHFKNNSSIEIIVHENFGDMYEKLKKDKEDEMNPVLVSTPFLKNNQKDKYHFDIDSIKLRWSTKSLNWTETEASKNLEEVGYVSNVQGKGFKSVGLIIGNDFSWEDSELKLDISKNINHFQFVKGESEENYINAINRLRVFLTRTSEKIHLYIVDEKLRKHIKNNI